VTIWLDGRLVTDETGIATATDRGLLLGDGLFETIKVIGGRAIFLPEHLARLCVSAREMALPIDRAQIREGISTLLDAVETGETGTLRLTVTRGPAPRGLAPVPTGDQRPRLFMTYAPNAVTAEGAAGADRLLLAPHVRASGAPTSRMKTLSYADNLMVRAWALREKAADAVFLNEHGQVTSTTMANLFVEMDEGFATPPLSAGLLPGVVREVLIRRAPQHGVAVKVRPLEPADLVGRRIFRTNSLIGVKAGWLDHGRGARRPLVSGPSDLERVYRLTEREESA
jgi:branched-chain amino acid aminotransferase